MDTGTGTRSSKSMVKFQYRYYIQEKESMVSAYSQSGQTLYSSQVSRLSTGGLGGNLLMPSQ